MTLSEKDGKLYYKLWLPLLDFVNKKYKVNINLEKIESAESLNPNEVKAVSDKLCENVLVIDEYLLNCKEMPDEHKEIIRGWKRSVRGRFIIERHLKKGSIMISMEDKKVYQVSGIVSSIEEMFFYSSLPLVVEATLMLFRNIIITDGLIMPYNIVIGGNMKKALKDEYMTAKKNGMIQSML